MIILYYTRILTDLTLTSVVFEFIINSTVPASWSYLTLTSVVFESAYYSQ